MLRCFALAGSKALPTESENVQLVKQAQSGTPEGDAAFSLLIARHTPLVHALATRYACDAFDTEDLSQEGFLGLMSAIRTFCPDKAASFRTYASVCVRNRIISHLRKQTSLPTAQQEQLIQQEKPQADPMLQLIEQEAAGALQNRLKQLLSPFEYQILLMHLCSFSYQEMAQRLQTTPKAVDNAWQRIRRKCDQLLA